MSTGLLIRDFFKENRELRYSGSGSIRLSEIEHNAYRNSLTLEVTHVDAPRYENLKTLPNNSHYGYSTLFKGTTVADSISIKYPKFRLFDIINPHIWQYHQNTESKVLQTRELAKTVEEGISLGFVSDVLAGEWAVGILSDAAGWFYDTLTNVWEFWAARLPGGDGGEPLGDGDGYRAFPVASPFPDVIKFKADIPASFLFRLESWYLVNPAVYIVDNPTDSGDQTEGEDEYPEPERGDGDGDGDEFPSDDAPDPSSDPRDYPSDSDGLDPSRPLKVTVTWKAISAGCADAQGTTEVIRAFEEGNWTLDYGSANDGPGTGCPQNNGFSDLYLVSPSGARILIIGGVMRDGSTIDSVVNA